VQFLHSPRLVGGIKITEMYRTFIWADTHLLQRCRNRTSLLLEAYAYTELGRPANFVIFYFGI
jgi:hypothetical protein